MTRNIRYRKTFDYSNYFLIKLFQKHPFLCSTVAIGTLKEIYERYSLQRTLGIRRNEKSNNSNMLDWQQIKSETDVEVWN